MKIAQFEQAAHETCPGLDLERLRNLFVVAEAATLREGPIAVLGRGQVASLMQRCFPDRDVRGNVEQTPCLLYLDSTDPVTLVEARRCIVSAPELVVVAEQASNDLVAKTLAGLEIQILESDQVVAQKVGSSAPACHWPWTEYSAYVDGHIGVCCGAGGLDKATPDNAGRSWNSPGTRQLRQNLLRGEYKGICANCQFRLLYNQEVRGTSPKSDLVFFPKTMSLIITEKCNLRCWFCNYTKTYATANRIKSAPEIDIELLEEIAPRFWKHVGSLNTNCGGEVFLYPHWDRILKLMKRYPPKSAISTSGGGIEVADEDWFKILETHTHWSFSVDSFDPETHYVLRGCDIGIVRRNVEKIRRLRDAHFPDRQYGFSCVLMKMTIPRLYDFVRTAIEDYGGSYVGFQHVIDQPTETCATEPQWRQLFNIELNKAKHYCRTRSISMGHPVGYYLDAVGKPEGLKFFKHPETL